MTDDGFTIFFEGQQRHQGSPLQCRVDFVGFCPFIFAAFPMNATQGRAISLRFHIPKARTGDRRTQDEEAEGGRVRGRRCGVFSHGARKSALIRLILSSQYTLGLQPYPQDVGQEPPGTHPNHLLRRWARSPRDSSFCIPVGLPVTPTQPTQNRGKTTHPHDECRRHVPSPTRR